LIKYSINLISDTEETFKNEISRYTEEIKERDKNIEILEQTIKNSQIQTINSNETELIEIKNSFNSRLQEKQKEYEELLNGFNSIKVQFEDLKRNHLYETEDLHSNNEELKGRIISLEDTIQSKNIGIQQLNDERAALLQKYNNIEAKFDDAIIEKDNQIEKSLMSFKEKRLTSKLD